MKALVVLSGGQDSTTCLALAIKEFGVDNVHAITFNYGQRHRVEVDAAKAIAQLAKLGDRHEVVDVPAILKGSSPLVNGAVAVEQYASAEVLPGGLEKTFVPMRNQFFLTIAANRAVLIGIEAGIKQAGPKGRTNVTVFTGVSQEDYGGYPDCREPFIDYLAETIRLSNDDASLPFIAIRTPLMYLTKAATVEVSEKLDALQVSAYAGDTIGTRDLLAYSHTCYNGEVPPCGKCHACLLRAKGYEEAGVTDPLLERLKDEAVTRDLSVS
jgi:7-cyano-7-deazaguanine synthase